jgi:ABC-type nickel/cobalt efflux system permease component RcnA
MYRQQSINEVAMMLKTIYAMAWILVALAAIVSLLGDHFSSLTQVAFSVAVLVLVYALALWSVFTNTKDIRAEIFSRSDEINFNGGNQ